jgi:hypothetical protein
LEFRRGDVFTINQRVSALSSPTAPDYTTISFHVRNSRYGGEINQAFV